MNIDLNRLKTFHRIYTLGSVSAAARELFVTQSAASQNLARLERELNATLFLRVGKKLIPTASAQALFGSLGPVFQALEHGLADLEKRGRTPTGVLRIGAPVEFGSKYLVELCARFRRRYPDVGFALKLGQTADLLPELSAGRLDFAFADIFKSEKGYSREFAIFTIKLAAQEELVLACSARYFKKAGLGRKPSAQQLLSCAFLDYSPHAPAVNGWFEHHYGLANPKPRLALVAESVQAQISAMKSGMGLGVVPRHLIATGLKSGEFVRIETRRPELVNKISLLRLKDGAPGAAEKAFLEEFSGGVQFG